jgi:hypothetical protein
MATDIKTLHQNAKKGPKLPDLFAQYVNDLNLPVLSNSYTICFRNCASYQNNTNDSLS